MRIFPLVLALLGCSEIPLSLQEVPGPEPQKIVVIRTDDSVYTWSWNKDTTSVTVYFFSLVNTVSNDTLFSTLGNSPGGIDHTDLFAARSSDAFIEKLEPHGQWVEKELREPLRDPLRATSIRPGKNYRLITHLTSAKIESGTFRIRLQYYQTVDAIQSSPPMVDYSNTFVIR